MGRPVTGFLANDGSFHETEAQADFRDAEEEIRNWCVTHTPNPVDDNALLEYVEALADPISRYLDAKDRIDVEATREEVTTQVGGIDRSSSTLWAVRDHLATVRDVEGYTANDTPTEEDLAALLQQSPDRHEPMPHVGSSASAEGVLDEHESDGTGSRVGDARSVRSDQDLATDATSRP